jgi:hypothetical protein
VVTSSSQACVAGPPPIVCGGEAAPSTSTTATRAPMPTRADVDRKADAAGSPGDEGGSIGDTQHR